MAALSLGATPPGASGSGVLASLRVMSAQPPMVMISDAMLVDTAGNRRQSTSTYTFTAH